jgi:transcriptional repressor NrdR
VIKKDQSREPFNSDKIRNGIIRSAYKRPISTETIDEIVDSIDAEVRRMGMKEVPTSVIGGLLMEALKNLDAISYIRYASVYLRLEDAEELGKLLKDVTQVTKVTKGKSL